MKATKTIMATAVVIAAAVTFMQRDGGADHILITDVNATVLPNREVLVTLSIENKGEPDRLKGATSSEAKTHFAIRDGLDGPPLPANSTVSLSPEGTHITLTGLEGEPLKGRLIAMTLILEHAGRINVKAEIKSIQKHGNMHLKTMKMDHGGMHLAQASALKPAITIAAGPQDDGWRITVSTQNFTFSQEAADGPHEEGVGHGHLYVGGMKIGRVYGDTAQIGALPKGKHQVRLTLNTNDHRAYVVGDQPVTATATIVVD